MPKLNPYQENIAGILGISGPADLEAVEDAMRTARGTLNGLSAAEFADEARLGWHVVRAGRVMNDAGLTTASPHYLDPAVHAAASIYVHNQMRGPLTRPMTFRAPELETVGSGPEWVTYAIPVAQWNPKLTRSQAGKKFGTAIPVQRRAVAYEALCRACGDIFNPDLSYPDRSGLEHYQGQDGRPCGGAGDIVGWW